MDYLICVLCYGVIRSPMKGWNRMSIVWRSIDYLIKKKDVYKMVIGNNELNGDVKDVKKDIQSDTVKVVTCENLDNGIVIE